MNTANDREHPKPPIIQGRVKVESDPAIPLTRAQLDSVFGGANRIDAARELIRLLRQGRESDHVA